MNKKDDPTRWRTDDDWDAGTDRLGFETVGQNGSHKKKRYQRWTLILPVGHSRNEISIGVRKSLLRTLAEAGLLILIAGLFVATAIHFFA